MPIFSVAFVDLPFKLFLLAIFWSFSSFQKFYVSALLLVLLTKLVHHLVEFFFSLLNSPFDMSGFFMTFIDRLMVHKRP